MPRSLTAALLYTTASPRVRRAAAARPPMGCRGNAPAQKAPPPLGEGLGWGQHDARSQGIALGECIVPQGSQKGRHKAVLF